MYIDTTTGKEVVIDDIDTTTTTNNNHNHNGGLYIQARNGQCVPIHIPSNCCAYQIGETSQIMSGGILQATPHCILRPTTTSTSKRNNNTISRESFALFLEPEFEDIINLPSNVQTIEDCQACSTTCNTNSNGNNNNENQNTIKLRPLSERWKPGQTFGEFHLATVSTFTTL
jgi:isopenicillin N synthase-like dioxygenase